MKISHAILASIFIHSMYMYSAQPNYTIHRPPAVLVRSPSLPNLIPVANQPSPTTPLSANNSPIIYSATGLGVNPTITGFAVEYKSIDRNLQRFSR